MDNENPTKIGNLPNKPLVEAIFELRWKIDSVENDLYRDPGWKLLPGMFYQEIKSEYPYSKGLPASQVPEELTGYSVHHQFRTEENGWPLIQIGPGILTVNDTTSYTVWDDFQPRVVEAIKFLKKVYTGTVTPIRMQLRFINALPYNKIQTDPVNFLREKLHITTDIGGGILFCLSGNRSVAVIS